MTTPSFPIVGIGASAGGLIVDTSRQAISPSGETHQATAPRRVLIADDNRDGAETMGMLLRLSDHEVYIAHSGTEALEVARNVRPDIGVLDIGMPDMNGYELAERIRHEAWGENMKLIAVTGWGQAEDKRRALAAGFNHHLTKPVDPDQLEALFKG